MRPRTLGLLVLALCSGACEAQQSSSPTMLELQIKLPPALREVSGLALTAQGTLLAVADEQALIYEIDLDQRTAEPWLAIGEPPLAGDFEGIEHVGERVWLVESNGTLLWSDGEAYGQMVTGLGDVCEIEGLVQDPHSQRLLLLCKKHRDEALRDQLQLKAVNMVSGAPDSAADIVIDLGAALQRLDVKKLNPSGVAFARDGSELVVIAAKQKALLVFSRAGALLHADRLPKIGKHRQAEGITLLADGRMVIADEGGKKAGRLSIYGRVYDGS